MTMRAWSLVLLSFVASTALASTTATLVGQSCTNNGICFEIANDAGLDISYINIAPKYGSMSASINGVVYSTPLHSVNLTAVNGVISVKSVPLFASDGTQISVSLDMGVQVKYVSSGKFHGWMTYYTLLDGKVVTP
jgi:hypothetical protein